MPPAESSIGILSKAIARLEAKPMVRMHSNPPHPRRCASVSLASGRFFAHLVGKTDTCWKRNQRNDVQV